MSQPLPYQPSKSAVYYVAPRRYDLPRTIWGTLLAAILIMIGACCYGHFLPSLPSLTLRLFAAGAAAVATGGLALMAIYIGRVQSILIAVILGCLLSCLSLYTMWVVWVHDFLSRNEYGIPWSALALHPYSLMKLIKLINHDGTWLYRGQIVKGTQLLIYWFGEAAGILACGVIFPMKGLSSQDPICRHCLSRCKIAPAIPRFADDNLESFVASIENHDFQRLLSQPPPADDDAPEIGLRIYSCMNCAQTHVLTVNRIAWELVKGRAQVTITPKINRMLITLEQVGEILTLAEQVKQQRDAVR